MDFVSNLLVVMFVFVALAGVLLVIHAIVLMITKLCTKMRK